MWGGRFASGPSAIMEAINASIDFDKRLYREDIAGSIAHAEMLGAQGIISAEDAAEIRRGLESIRAEIEEGRFAFSKAREDIHMNVEARLAELIRPGRRAPAHRALAQRTRWPWTSASSSRAPRRTSTAALRALQEALLARAE